MNSKKSLMKLLKLILLLALITALFFASAALIYTLSPDSYEDTYYAELPRKTDRLASVPGRRVIVIGGSSVAFGIDSKLIEKELGIPCVNFGLYAAFGLKPMLDLSLPQLHEGDIVIVAPEVSAQMYSSYCGYDYLLQAFENDPARLIALGTDYYPGLVSKLPRYLTEGAALREKGGAANPGVYALSSFDACGDIIYPRSENIMDMGYTQDNLPEIDPSVVTADFLDMVNEFVRSARKKGAEVYFSFSPINALSVKDVPADRSAAFTDALKNGLTCELLSPLDDHIMDAGFFYDSNYHLNDTGMRYHSLLLVSDLQRVCGAMHEVSALPKPPVLHRDNTVLFSGVTDGVCYDVTARGAVVTGLDDAGRARTALVIPQTLGETSVFTVSAGAFAGSRAQEITLPETITRLPGALFAGADKLKQVTLLSETLPEVGDTLLKDAPAALVLRVPARVYGVYITDYFWGAYAGSLAEAE